MLSKPAVRSRLERPSIQVWAYWLDRRSPGCRYSVRRLFHVVSYIQPTVSGSGRTIGANLLDDCISDRLRTDSRLWAG